MPGKPIPVADKAIANAALTELLMDAFEAATDDRNAATAVMVSADLLDRAARIRFQPSTRQLVLTFDLAMGETTE